MFILWNSSAYCVMEVPIHRLVLLFRPFHSVHGALFHVVLVEAEVDVNFVMAMYRSASEV